MEHDVWVKIQEAEAKINNTTFDEIPSEDEYVSPPSEEQDENHDALDFTNIGED